MCVYGTLVQVCYHRLLLQSSSVGQTTRDLDICKSEHWLRGCHSVDRVWTRADMDSLDLTTLLEECLQLAGKEMTTLDKETFRLSRDTLSAELNTLLQEAVDMKWPFVEEKWQYKRSVSSDDKVNTMDLINQHLPQIMAFLKASILAAEPLWAMSVVFLVDRFLYWIDSSHTLLKIAKALHRRYPETPVAPQIVIRQARVYLNTGKLQKAEYILSSLINNSGTTGCWKYQRDSDRILVQAVSVQVRGQVLQKLGLWLEAAELIWASLIGFYILPLPDKKGIGTSLGLLASVLISMNDKDFATFQKRPHINLGFLGDCRHRLLCAAQAAKMAVVYSQFGSLYVLTHMVTQGTCLLSYSFSRDCPAAEKPPYLALAKEAFENGLLTKAEKDMVTSQQELHTLIKAAYCLAITNKWMFGPVQEVTMAIQACQEANAQLYSYCFKDDSDKVVVSSEVMAKVQRVKALLKVKAFASSDPHSFIPDSYQAMEDRPVPFTYSDFTKMIEMFQKHHKSVCEAFQDGGSERHTTHANCLTAFQTTLTEALNTECSSRNLGLDGANKDVSDSSGLKIPFDPSNEAFFKKETIDVTLDSNEPQPDRGSSSLGSSWLHILPDSGGSLGLVDQFCCTEADEDVSGEKISHGSKCRGANSNSSHRVCDNHQSITFPSSHSAGVLDKGVNTQQQSNKELFTHLKSEERETTNKTDTNAARKGKETSTSSGSLSSSLGSSWQSISFSKSPLKGDFAEILKKSTVDQNCETVDEDGPDSPFQVVNPNCSATAKGLTKTHKGCHPQICVQNQSSIETVNDVDVLSLSDGLSGLAIAVNHPNGLSAQQQSKKELFTTLESEDHETTNKMKENATGKGKGTTMSSGSRSSSLGSSWQSVSFSKSPLNEDFAEISKNKLSPSLLSTEFDSFEMVQPHQPEPKVTIQGTTTSASVSQDLEEHLSKSNRQQATPSCMTCDRCFKGCTMGNIVVTEQDYKSLFSGVCQGCLLRRLPEKTFKLSQYNKAYNAILLKYSKATETWTGCETSVYVGEVLQVAVKGAQRQAFRIQYLHQEQLLGSYVGKEYLREREPRAHLEDVERQMTAQYYVMEFNKRLYESNITTQIFYIPSELLLITEADRIVACVSVEPYMLGDFVKLTNNTTKINKQCFATEYGIAFGHFTYAFSNKKEVVVDLQGWVTANGKGLAYLTDPQIHSLRKPKSSNNFHQNGILKFMQEQHGEHCGPICRAALHTLTQ
ncbi:alpha-protein kinase 1 isoform X2 [Salminus brasiliensis]|uniref:alpha-protein kinase 1 isoform X2 n=1 Tax=Salminus brasiliensis TaxID=930266 RepID=UPI003B8386CE